MLVACGIVNGMKMVLLVGHWTCSSQVQVFAGHHCVVALGQATYACVPLSPSTLIWYRPRGVMSSAGKVTVGLAESNGSLPLGLCLTKSPVGWDQDRLRAHCLLLIEYWIIFFYFMRSYLNVAFTHTFGDLHVVFSLYRLSSEFVARVLDKKQWK